MLFQTVLSSVYDLGTQQVHESNDITVDLNVPDSIPSYDFLSMDVWRPDSVQWYYYYTKINDYITFINVERNIFGNYELHVLNEAESSTGTFELDVQCK